MPNDKQRITEDASVVVIPANPTPQQGAPTEPPAPAPEQAKEENPTLVPSLPNILKRIGGALGALLLVSMLACSPVAPPTPSHSDAASVQEDHAVAAGHQDYAGVADETDFTLPGLVSGAPVPGILNGGFHAPQMWRTTWKLEKRWGDDPSAVPYETIYGQGNLLTLAGAKALWQGFSGGTVAGGAYTGSSGNATIAVGDAGAGSSTLPNPLPAANVGDVDVDAGFTAIGTSISSSTCSAGVVTVTTSAAHGLSNTLDVGQIINIYNPTVTGTGYTAGTAGYQGTYTIASAPTTTTFTYNLNNGGTCPTSNLGAGGSVRMGQAPLAATAVSCSAGTTTVTVASGAPAAGQTVVSTGNVPSGYNGTYLVATSNGSTSFTYAETCPAANTTLGHFTGANRLRQQVTTAITYAPSGTPNGVQFVSTFGTSSANWTWGSWGIDNAGTGQAFANLFNHAIVGPAAGNGLGLKTSASSWQLTVTESVS